jgi:hypothetical protein
VHRTHFIKRVSGSKGFETKTITDDGAKRAFSILYKVKACAALTAIRGFFHTASLLYDLLFPKAKE